MMILKGSVLCLLSYSPKCKDNLKRRQGVTHKKGVSRREGSEGILGDSSILGLEAERPTLAQSEGSQRRGSRQGVGKVKPTEY